MDGKQFPLNYKAVIFPISKQSAIGHVFFSVTFLIQSCLRRVKGIDMIFLETPDVDPPV